VVEGGVYRVIADYVIATDTSTPKSVWASSIAKPDITQNRGLLTCSVTAPAYQWFRNNVAIPNSNTKTLLATAAGTYTVRVTEKKCSFISNGLAVTVLDTKQLNAKRAITAFWIAAEQAIHVKSDDATWQRANLISADGRQLPLTKNKEGHWISNSSLTSGMYWLRLSNESGVQTVALPINLN
jgi:hypothetical protein